MTQNTLTKDMAAIAKEMYHVADAIKHDFPDEEWRTVSKLKNAANDSYFYCAQVAGAGNEMALEFDCTSARKYVSALRAMYIFASKQDMTELDPALVVKIDAIIAQIDVSFAESEVALEKRRNDDLEPWLKKYKIWQEISKG